MIIIGDRRSDSWNFFGHASIAISGGGLYSFGTDTACGAPVGDFIRSQSNVRDQIVFRIKTTPAQDKQMLDSLRQYGQCKTVPLFPDNCAYRVEKALRAGGIGLNDPFFSSPFPASLLRSLLIRSALGMAQQQNVPMNSSNSPDTSDFEPH